ncbi:MAG: DMT family transporter [Acetobacterales bacterium]
MTQSTLATRTTAFVEAIPGNVRGSAWMALGAMCFALQVTMMKLLGDGYHSFLITFLRSATMLMLVLPAAIRVGADALRTQRLGLHAGRGVASGISLFCLVYAFTHLPLAEATAFTFTKPLFMTVLIAIMLPEVVFWQRWAAVCVGFVGVLIMMRPGLGGLDPNAFVALGGAFFFAVVNVLVKQLSGTERPVTILLYAAIFTSLISFVPALFVWQWPDPQGWLLILLMAVFSALNQYLMIRAWRVADACAVVPFDYTRLIWSGLIGWYFFSELPDVFTLISAGVIVAAALYIAFHEVRSTRRRNRRAAA